MNSVAFTWTFTLMFWIIYIFNNTGSWYLFNWLHWTCKRTFRMMMSILALKLIFLSQSFENCMPLHTSNSLRLKINFAFFILTFLLLSNCWRNRFLFKIVRSCEDIVDIGYDFWIMISKDRTTIIRIIIFIQALFALISIAWLLSFHIMRSRNWSILIIYMIDLLEAERLEHCYQPSSAIWSKFFLIIIPND